MSRPGRWILVALLALTATLWLFLIHSHGAFGGPAGRLHDHFGSALGGSTIGRAASASLLWLVMMAAMMTPAALPWIVVLAGHVPASGDHVKASIEGRAPYIHAASLLAGYLTVWSLFSLLAATSQLVLLRSSLLEPQTLRLGTRAAASVLLLAGVYELTPIKKACLRRCRSPVGLFLAGWTSRPASRFRLGLRHGIVCVACCWALMALAFATGVVSLTWMAVLTAIVCAQKLLPMGDRLPRVVGVALVCGGIVLLS